MKAWINLLPSVEKELDETEDSAFEYYFLSYDNIPEYIEIKWKDSVFPLTHYMFIPDEGDIEAIWYELLIMNQQQGLIGGIGSEYF